jgi:hypothetical protein
MRTAMMSRRGTHSSRRRLRDGGHLHERLQTFYRLTCQSACARNIAERGDRDEEEKGSHDTSRSAWLVPPALQALQPPTIGGSPELGAGVAETTPVSARVPPAHTEALRFRFRNGRLCTGVTPRCPISHAVARERIEM